MISGLGKLGVRIATLVGMSLLVAAPAQAAPPVCSTMTIGPIPGYANAQITVTEAMILNNCSDPDGDTLQVTSPAVPYTIYVQPNNQWYTFVHTVSDGNGGTTTQTIRVTRN